MLRQRSVATLSAALVVVVSAGCSSSHGVPNGANVAAADCLSIADNGGSDPTMLETLVRDSLLTGPLPVDKHRWPDLCQALQSLDGDLTASGGVMTPLATQDLGEVTGFCSSTVPGYVPPTTT